MRKIAATRTAAGLLDEHGVAAAVESFTDNIRQETGFDTKYASDGQSVSISVHAKGLTVDFISLTADRDENDNIKGLIVAFPGNNGALRFELVGDDSGLAPNQSGDTLRLPDYIHV